MRRLAVALVAALALVSCGGEGGEENGAAAGDEVTLKKFDNRFENTEIEIPAGGSVSFVGAGRNPHNAVAADGSWSTETDFGSLEQHDGDLATLTFNTPGTYTFFCTFHGSGNGAGMAGTLVVGG